MSHVRVVLDSIDTKATRLVRIPNGLIAARRMALLDAG